MESSMMGYDRATTVFSPDGRLFQVEYAREAVQRGTTAIGMKYKNGVTLIVDRKLTSKLVEIEKTEKIFKICDHIGCATSGLVGDARVLIDRARVEAQRYKISYDEPIMVESLVKNISNYVQMYTQLGGLRPFGTALLVAGVDNSGTNLFEADPSGAMIAYKATAIGSEKMAVLEVFESEYEENMDRDKAIELGIRSLYHATEGRLNPKVVEIVYIDSEEKKYIKNDPEDVEKMVRSIIEKL